MIPFKLSERARNDLKQIARFTESKWGRKQRYIYLKEFDDAFFMLSESPEIGQTCDIIKTGYRKFPQGSHIIFYKPGAGSKIEIVRVLHNSMDVFPKSFGQ